MRRFYETAVAVAVDDGYQISLDGRPVHTPAKARLVIPGEPLAQAVAGEWNDQQETVEPSAMPLTALANTAIDRVSSGREAVIAGILAYAETDLLCYRAERPAGLVERQSSAWQPLLDWAALELDAPLTVTRGILPVSQPRSSVKALAKAVDALDDFQLAAVGSAAGLLGSIVLALALAAGRIGASDAVEAAHLDDFYQLEVWGSDSEAKARLDGLRQDIVAMERFLRLLGD